MSRIVIANPYLTVAEVAARLNVGPRTVHRMIARGELPVVRVGGSLRIPGNELEDQLREQTRSVER